MRSRMTEIWDAEDEADISSPSTQLGTYFNTLSQLLNTFSDSSEEGEPSDSSGQTEWSLADFRYSIQ